MSPLDDRPTRVARGAPPESSNRPPGDAQEIGTRVISSPPSEARGPAPDALASPQHTHQATDTSPLQRFTSSHDVVPRVSPGHDAGTDPDFQAPGDSRYAFGPELGVGGIGHVHLATDRDMRRAVAIKSLRDEHKTDPLLLRAFLEEAIITGGLSHPNIVPVYEVGISETVGPYYAMKRIAGRSLSDVLSAVRQERDDAPALPRLIEFFAQTLRAIAHAHARGVIHCDLKPANIIVGTYGEVTVVDWGLAKVMGQQGRWQARAQLWSGSPGYMAPEQALTADIAALDARSDIWSLGAMLYELICWVMPFADDEGHVPDDLFWREIPAPSQRPWAREVPQDLADLAMRALSREPDDRPQTVLEMLAEVEAWLDGSRQARQRDEVAGFSALAMQAAAARAAAEVDRDKALIHWRDGARHLASGLKARPEDPRLLGQAAVLYWRVFSTIYPGGDADEQTAAVALELLARVIDLAPSAVVRERLFVAPKGAATAAGTAKTATTAATTQAAAAAAAAAGDAWLDAALSVSGDLGDNPRLSRLIARIRLLASTAIFSGMGASRLLPIAAACATVSLKAGEVLFAQGDAGDALYIVQTGQIRIDRGGLTLAIVPMGRCFGEIAVIDGAPRTASAIAAQQCQLLALTADRFEDLIRGDSTGGDLGLSVMRFLTARLRIATEREAHRAVTPAG